MANAAPGVEMSVSPLWTKIVSLTSSSEPEPNVWTAATNGDHDALTETPTAETETTASGADVNDDDTDDEHEHVNTETEKNIDSKKRYR